MRLYLFIVFVLKESSHRFLTDSNIQRRIQEFIQVGKGNTIKLAHNAVLAIALIVSK